MKDTFLKIDEDVKSKILELFGKSTKELEETVAFIKEWLKTQRHLPETPSDTMIEYFLVNNKFSLENTKKKIDAYYVARTIIHEQIGNIHPKLDQVKVGFNSIYIVPLPKLKEGLYRIILVKFKNTPHEQFFVEANMANILNLYEVRMHEDLMSGDIVIVDQTFASFAHIVKVSPSHIKLATNLLETVYSNRIKEVHIINYPPAVEYALNIVKLFVKPKIISRIQLHKTLNSLTQYVPLELLPKDYGGEQKSLDELEDLMKEKLEEYGPRFDKIEKMRVNENLRTTPMKPNDEFGVEGSFRKLNLD